MFKTRSNFYFINNGEIENVNEGLGLGCLKPLSTIENVSGEDLSLSKCLTI
jgi:hypothetical protein